ncbi:response regulator transcription factor [Uliginosibacterium sp. H3]|uniref:Response regulator transcription factor n=1 Tax=Uliginosibacterium silvisoli TaxID=3114758 RepID=A0ABU6K743_9RHOO|nr:response regulator transcription factor [Uliginosibacterium sp. H3]
MMRRLDSPALHILTADDTVFHRIREMEHSDEQGRPAGDWPWRAQRLQRPIELDNLPVGSLVMIDNAHPQRPDWADARWRVWAGHLSIIVMSSEPQDAEGIAAMDAGASGYCHAFANAAILKQVVEVVSSGELWVGRSLLTRLLKGVDRGLAQHKPPSIAPHWQDKLTEREAEVARMAAQGASNIGIAEVLGITERTVKAHLTSIFDKLDVADRLQLALKVHGVK